MRQGGVAAGSAASSLYGFNALRAGGGKSAAAGGGSTLSKLLQGVRGTSTPNRKRGMSVESTPGVS